MTRRHLPRLLGAAVLIGAAGIAPGALAASDVNVYSLRQEVLIRPLLDRFEQTSGINVNVVFAKEGVLQRLKAEGMNSAADVVLTVDAARLIRIDQEGLLQPVRSKVLEESIPPQYRAPDGSWFGLSIRARPIIYSPERVDPKELSTYEGLADPKWKGRICIRSSTHVYNQSLLASMIAHRGPEKTEEWTKGFVANFARKPQGGDRDQIRAVAAGECDIAIANTYYLAGMIKSPDAADRAAAEKVKIFWPNQDGYGTHVNISGAGVTKASKNRESAVALLEFLVSDEAQRIYADKVNEYPVKPGVPITAAVEGFGDFKADDLPLATLAEHHAEAVRIADRAGWR